MAEGSGYVDSINPVGAVDQWNSESSPEMQICVCDRIDAYHVKGKDPRTLRSGRELEQIDCRAIVLKLAKPSIYTVTIKAKFGMSTKTKRDPDFDKPFFVIATILPVGSIAQWNKDCPDKLVSVGDIVRAVNGVKGTAREVQHMLATSSDEPKELLIFHYPMIV